MRLDFRPVTFPIGALVLVLLSGVFEAAALCLARRRIARGVARRKR